MDETLAREEYAELRATIRQRGTARVWLFWVSVASWAALTTATGALSSLPISTLVPLVVLACGFEGVLALHVGVERVGRYLQVRFEETRNLPGWETTTMAFGERFPGAGPDPLFPVMFGIAALLNLVPALLLQPTRAELGVLGAAHLMFLGRVFRARQVAGRQRAADLARFREIARTTT